jgi:hypothetical protein
LREAEPKQAVADTPKTVKTISRGPSNEQSNEQSNGQSNGPSNGHGGH